MQKNRARCAQIPRHLPKEIIMSEREMFEKSFKRPANYFSLSQQKQYDIDRRLGILDWKGKDLTEEDKKRFKEHYK